jgi:F0F1-type ATP synthase membrane subunit b/b'
METSFYAPIVNFAAVVGVLVFAGRKPIAAIFQGRHETIGNAVQTAEAEHKEASALLQTAEAQQKNLEAEIATSHTAARTILEKFKDDTLKAAEKESVRIRQEAKLIVDNEATRARHQLEKDISVRCIRLAADSLKGQVSEVDQNKLTQEFMDGLPNGKGGHG